MAVKEPAPRHFQNDLGVGVTLRVGALQIKIGRLGAGQNKLGVAQVPLLPASATRVASDVWARSKFRFSVGSEL